MSDKPVVIDEVAATDVYVASLELRSVGTSKNIFPVVRFSHHFTEEPDVLPYSYRAILQIAEKIGAQVAAAEDVDAPEDGDIDDVVRMLDAETSDRGDDPIH